MGAWGENDNDNDNVQDIWYEHFKDNLEEYSDSEFLKAKLKELNLDESEFVGIALELINRKIGINSWLKTKAIKHIKTMLKNHEYDCGWKNPKSRKKHLRNELQIFKKIKTE